MDKDEDKARRAKVAEYKAVFALFIERLRAAGMPRGVLSVDVTDGEISMCCKRSSVKAAREFSRKLGGAFEGKQLVVCVLKYL